MHWFGVVKLTESLQTTFEGKVCPRKDTTFDPVAMQYAGGLTWDEISSWPKPELVMPNFTQWLHDTLEPGTTPLFWTDNNGHDMKWLSLYMDEFGDDKILGHTSRNLNDRYRGFKEGMIAAGKKVPKRFSSLEKLATTKHDHTPVNDTLGMAEAMLALREIGFPVEVHS